ncbi:MAG: hypothetical protein OCD02_22755 [Spirochaetaceae bacterium]
MNPIKIILILLFFTLSLTISANSVNSAIELAYNFQFDESQKSLDRYRNFNPSDIDGDLGQIIFDFLMIKQNPTKDNFKKIYSVLKDTEKKIKKKLKKENNTKDELNLCLVNYYYMKSYALENKWLTTLRYAVEARKISLTLADKVEDIPDLYFILGEQNYTTALAPKGLKPLLEHFDFVPDRQKGIKLIEVAAKKGHLTKYEATVMYISSSIYIEKDYDGAYRESVTFLKEFPNNLSVQFFYIDTLLRKGITDEPKKLLGEISKRIDSGEVKGKWIPRYIQMLGNLSNVDGDYEKAITYYRDAIKYKDISGFTATEINLEMGKLLDIIGNRKSAISTYKSCIKGQGLELHKDEARELKSSPYKGAKASY